MARRNTGPTVLPNPKSTSGHPSSPSPVDGDVEFAAWLGERTRRFSLGLTAALLTARAYWPGEPDVKAEAVAALGWDLAVLIAAGFALAAALIGGAFRIRWSRADAAVIALMLLVGLSSTQAYDRRIAINLAWDWAALGVMYLLVRNLPRTSSESTALAGAMVATAVAVSVYGLYQVGVEFPQMRAYYAANKLQVLQNAGVVPGTPGQVLFENRLLGSNEVISTFALANSLAGFLVVPLVVMLTIGWENLLGREGKGSRFASLAIALVPTLIVAICLMLTKSRSAWIGLAVAIAILAFRERRRVSTRTLLLTGFGGLALLAAFIFGGLATGRLDREVLTQSPMSLRYRGEYWVGAWRVITENTQAFWMGHGPGNFTASYLRYKLPQASEEIFDPHNLILEVWATAGTPAMVALVLALGFAFVDLFGRSKRSSVVPEGDTGRTSSLPASEPPRSATWLVAWGAGGLLMVVMLGQLNPFVGDLFSRWLILGTAWIGALLCGMSLWRRLPLPAVGLAAGSLALAINLLAAGGIGIGPVALMLWVSIALGLNLREDRACGQLRELGGRLPAFGVSMVWSAVIGSFFGAILPVWRANQELDDAETALHSRPPQFERAENAYVRAYTLDRFSSRPWFGLAFSKFEEWRARGSKVDDRRWKAIPVALADAVKAPRNPNSWALHHQRALVIRDLLAKLGPQLSPKEVLTYRSNIIADTRRASMLYPSNATLHAELAQASAEIGMVGDAVTEAKEALRLDKLLAAHKDKQLAPAMRKFLEDQLPRWEKDARGMPGAGSLSKP